MANLTEYAILNGIDNDLRESIEYVGGDTSNAEAIVDLAEVIKTQLTANKTVGEGVYDKWMFGSPDTNHIYEPVTESTNAVQAKVIANSIKDVYEVMKKSHKPLIYIVDQLPETKKSLSALYLLKQTNEEENVVRKQIDITSDLTTMPGHKGTVKYEDNIITVSPDSSGEINAIFGWDGLNCKIDDFNEFVLRTNILSWGESGVSYSLDGEHFFQIKSDTIVLTKEDLLEQNIDRITKIVFLVDSVNTKYKCTEILIREAYLEKTEKYVSSYTMHHFVKEGNDVIQVDCGNIHIDFNQLFYIARPEFADNIAKINGYIDALESTLKKQLGSFLKEGAISLEDTINILISRCDEIDRKLANCVMRDELATQETAGLMSASDKIKLDNIGSITDEYLNKILEI